MKTAPDLRLSAAIRSIRKKAGLTMVEFAKQVGVSQAAVHNWESGKNTPNVAVLAALLTKVRDDDAESRQILHEAINELAGRHGGVIMEAADALVEYRRGMGERAAEFAREAQRALEAGPDQQLLSILRYYNEFRQDPEPFRAFFEAAAYLSVHAAKAKQTAKTQTPESNFGDVTEKELQRLENLLYFLRHADADEVDEVVRRAAAFRRFNEKERKHTPEAKPARRGRR